jgi:hypothetical protein
MSERNSTPATPSTTRTTGPERAALYPVALWTGFRADALRSLTLESFRWDDNPPGIVCFENHALGR